MSMSQLAGLSTALVLAWVVQSAVLLVVVVMFIIRNVYIMFVTAISHQPAMKLSAYLFTFGTAQPNARRGEIAVTNMM
jgi:hypothetical protein